ncbi:MAG: hypothetical protein BMS9Abin01_1174 [Gammaproteobacteria bacterium]|nr:MAG: hypothetical protein BMS9Abin01_1174 [Gammaproteobacteria bacterium]
MGTMSTPADLAYVFWHWIEVDTDVAAYEDALTAFQQALLDNAPPGYRRAAVFRHGPAPWLPGRGPHYVDWYVTDGSAALDPLNDAALSAACRAAHDAAAGRAAGGTAGLYRLRQGAARAAEVHCATWFSKPAGMSYEALDENLAERMHGAHAELWSRRMTLGPAPELCVLASSAIELPEAFGAIGVPMQPVWPGARSRVEQGDLEGALQ